MLKAQNPWTFIQTALLLVGALYLVYPQYGYGFIYTYVYIVGFIPISHKIFQLIAMPVMCNSLGQHPHLKGGAAELAQFVPPIAWVYGTYLYT